MMRQKESHSFGIYVPTESLHVIPFFEALRRVWPFECIYFYSSESHDEERLKYGWENAHASHSCLLTNDNRYLLESIPILRLGVRDNVLIERRLSQGLLTIYSSERWLKPPWGILRLFHPGFFRLCLSFVRFFKTGRFYYFPHGIHAARDMARICGLFSGDIRCLLRAPRLTFQPVPCGEIYSALPLKYKTHRIRLWGYFVSEGLGVRHTSLTGRLRILYVGRLIRLKRVDTLIKAFNSLQRYDASLTIVGNGPEETHLKSMVNDMSRVEFLPFQSMETVRAYMRKHDVLVFTSNGREGWGAVISEALEEGMTVIGTQESGAAATLLPTDCQFHAGDWKRLSCMLERLCILKARGELKGSSIGEWSAKSAAHHFAEFLKKECLER